MNDNATLGENNLSDRAPRGVSQARRRAPNPVRLRRDLEPVFPSSGEISHMSRTARLWQGARPLALGGLLVVLTGVTARSAEPPPLSQQLADLGRQVLARGDADQARTYFR